MTDVLHWNDTVIVGNSTIIVEPRAGTLVELRDNGSWGVIMNKYLLIAPAFNVGSEYYEITDLIPILPTLLDAPFKPFDMLQLIGKTTQSENLPRYWEYQFESLGFEHPVAEMAAWEDEMPPYFNPNMPISASMLKDFVTMIDKYDRLLEWYNMGCKQ
jgi:hypothetical protein